MSAKPLKSDEQLPHALYHTDACLAKRLSHLLVRALCETITLSGYHDAPFPRIAGARLPNALHAGDILETRICS